MEQNFDSNEHVVEQTTEHENSQEHVIVKPANNLVLAILTTICCCLPFGIVAIIKASQVNNLFMLKQYVAAQASANEAKKWSYIGIATGFVVSIIYLLFNLACHSLTR